MEDRKLIRIETLCTHYELEISFFESLEEVGLIVLEREKEVLYLPEERVSDLEKVIRLHEELNVNLEGIDVILNLLKKVESLQFELNSIKNRLKNLTEED